MCLLPFEFAQILMRKCTQLNGCNSVQTHESASVEFFLGSFRRNTVKDPLTRQLRCDFERRYKLRIRGGLAMTE